MEYSKTSFDEWLKEIPQKLDYMTNTFAQRYNLNLNCSITSLDQLEDWILKQYDVASDLKEEEETLDLLTVYVGETYIKHIGGEWCFEKENPKSLFHDQIVLKYVEDNDIYFRSPRLLCTTCISRKRGTLLSSTLQKSIAKK